MLQPGLGASAWRLQALAISWGSAKSKSKGWAGKGCCCLLLALALVPGGRDETVTPGQRILILLSGCYNDDVLEYFAQPAIDWRL